MRLTDVSSGEGVYTLTIQVCHWIVPVSACRVFNVLVEETVRALTDCRTVKRGLCNCVVRQR